MHLNITIAAPINGVKEKSEAYKRSHNVPPEFRKHAPHDAEIERVR